jgi:hypothetical protein
MILISRLETSKGRIAVKGTAGSNSTHSMDEDERRSFTDHINGVGLFAARRTADTDD